MGWRIGRFVLATAAVACIGAIGAMAFVRRDHKVELVVIYPKSPPGAVWRLLTDHAAEPKWLPAFGEVVRQADVGGHEVWTHTTPDRAFSFTVMTVSAMPETRYERLLLRDNQPRHQSWDGRWVYELRPHGQGTRLTITEYGWTDGVRFFISQRVLQQPDAFLKFYARRIGLALQDEPEIQVLRSH
jgi:uncharacterized protein YndB with AHSA1/START domain